MFDDCTRECLALVPDTFVSGAMATRELATLLKARGQPRTVVSDNGTEFTSNAILKWQEERHVEWHYITPGTPMRDTASWRASTAGSATNA